MVEVTEDDKEIAAELAHALGMTAEEFTSGACDVLVQIAARHRQAGVQQGLDMAAGVVEEGSSRWRDKSSATANKRESRDYETMAIACIHVAAAIRKLGEKNA